uniref:PLP-dependent transferase n=2 Tax=Lactococcus lactis subsp. cremoris TaxID=1359 RepID=UPI0004CF31C1
MDKRLDTLLAQVGIRQDEATGALVGPLHFSTTYQHPEYGKSTGFDYTRTKNPTRATLEEALASIESGQFALATSSGMAAIVLAFEVFPVGAKIVASRDLYGGSFRWFDEQEKEGRFSFSYANNEKEMLDLIDESTDIVYIESPTNPMMIKYNIEKIANKACQGPSK